MQPLVSVIVPNYNHAACLEERMQSILKQTYQNIEIILLDDASTDNSRQILDEFRAHPKVKTFLYNQTNNGGSSYRQWQKGFEECAGEWVWIAESDDWSETTFLQNLLGKAGPNCNLAFAQSMVVQDDRVLWSSAHNRLHETINGKEFVASKMINGNAVFNASMAIFRRSALATIRFDFAAFSFLGDWAFWAGIAASGDVLVCGKVLNYFRQNSSGVSAGAKKTGSLYAEYPQLVNLMVEQGWITAAERQLAVNAMFQRLLSDKLIVKSEKQKLENQYDQVVAVPQLKRLWRWRQLKRSVAKYIPR